MHQVPSTTTPAVPADDVVLTAAQMDQLLGSLCTQGQTWTIGRIEKARKGTGPMRVAEILETFDPEINENKAVILLRTIVEVITPGE